MEQNNIAHVLTSALTNPYSQYSSHYAQALARASHSRTTPEGYTLSATYYDGQPHLQPPRSGSSRPQNRQPQPSGWYQPGNHRCSYHDCRFTGSQKSLQLHMMDRHLIYPPGWEKHKKTEWDADPSLKGKSIPIQGTNIILNTPEALEAWIAERKKRWPTNQRTAEKKRKLDEAINRGQIIPQDHLFARKRPRRDDANKGTVESYPRFQRAGGDRRGGRGGGRGRGRGREPICSAIKPELNTSKVSSESSSTDDNERDDAPEIASSKVPMITSQPLEQVSVAEGTVKSDKQKLRTPRSAESTRRPTLRKPHNPFASRSTLLCNLLRPEIRITISNLSQAIRFLVDNDFLDGVELTPGDAEKDELIQVIGES